MAVPGAGGEEGPRKKTPTQQPGLSVQLDLGGPSREGLCLPFLPQRDGFAPCGMPQPPPGLPRGHRALCKVTKTWRPGPARHHASPWAPRRVDLLLGFPSWRECPGKDAPRGPAPFASGQAFHPCLPAWEGCGANEGTGAQPGGGILGRGFMASSGEGGTGAENWAGSGQRARGEYQTDEQLGWARAAEEEWHTVELWDGSPCPGDLCLGADGCSRSRLSQLLCWVPQDEGSWRVKVQSWLLPAQNRKASSTPWRRAGISAPRSVWGCLFLQCDSTARGSCMPPMWNIIPKGQGGPSQGTSVTPNRI